MEVEVEINRTTWCLVVTQYPSRGVDYSEKDTGGAVGCAPLVLILICTTDYFSLCDLSHHYSSHS